jgi:hypothetical protein
MPGRPPQSPLQTTTARRRRAHRPSAPPPNTVDHDSRGGDRRTPSLSFNPRAPSCGSAAAARRSQTLVANPLPEFNAHRPPGVSRLRSTRLQRRPASRRWHHPCRGTSLNPQAFQYHRFFESTLEHTERRHTPEGHFKPDPAILSTIMEEFHITPTRTLYVGDSLMKDVSMAQRAGVHDVHALMSVFKNGAVRLCPRQRWPVRMGAQGRRQGL